MIGLSPVARDHLNALARWYDAAPEISVYGSWYRAMLAEYYNLLIPCDASVLEVGCGAGDLLKLLHAREKTGIDISAGQIERARERLPEARFHVQAGEELDLEGKFDYIILSETINFAADVQLLFKQIHSVCHQGTRLVLNFFNTLWRPLISLATSLGVRLRQPECNWLSLSDVENLLRLSDWDLLSCSGRFLLPVRCLGLERIVNRYLSPIVPNFCLTSICVARPLAPRMSTMLSTSIVVPARNEAGNVEAAVTRTPMMGSATELIFVEGHSKDNTWEEIKRVAAQFPEKNITFLKQSGVGKGNAVREGFAAAKGDIVMILDADLTVSPEELPKFYEVIASGRADFANGVRLVYPMRDNAMQFLNLCANKSFSMLFTWLIGQPLKDTLCGTKVLLREHYLEIVKNRDYFGDFDPFGDFDLLFGAGKANLKIVDIPIRYGERTYGTTNISRWKHGWLLLKMAMVAARKLKFV